MPRVALRAAIRAGRPGGRTIPGVPLTAPTLKDVLAARERIRTHLSASPLRSYPGVDRLVGTEVFVKHENLLPTGAFKVRGGINLMSRLSEGARPPGVVTASTGNHGQSIAYAARRFGFPATVFAPEGANPVKVEAMRDLGAEVVLTGRNFDEARVRSEKVADERGWRHVHAANEPDLIAGVATHTLELLEARTGIDVILVPLGGGSGASGACIVARAIDPAIEVIAVQSARAPAAHDSWRSGRLVERSNATSAEGLATGTAFALTQGILGELLSDFILVGDEELFRAARIMVEKTRTLVEPSGAAGLAAALSPALRPRLRGRRVAIICTGANISPAQLREVLRSGEAAGVA